MTFSVTLPDNSHRTLAAICTIYDFAGQIGSRLQKEAIAATLNGTLVSLDTILDSDCNLEILTFDDPRGKQLFWHSSSHLLAQAVQKLYPEVKFAIGPSIENGFYYDFYRFEPFTPEDLAQIEATMVELVKAGSNFERIVLSRKDAIRYFFSKEQTFKVELVQSIKDETTSLYKLGNFTDLCRGPHLQNTSRIKAIKLLSVAGAYWRGDERNSMLQRIYGITFPTGKQLRIHLDRLEQAKKRDHRRLGSQLKLFFTDNTVGGGLIIFQPNGAALRETIESYEKAEHAKRGYQLVVGPEILKADIWKTSGHFEYYRDNMYFFQIDGQEYGLKPMNCPGHMLIYKSQTRSYRELPIRYFELGRVHRHEKSGVLHGLMRVREFTQDDAHIFCTPEQLETEIVTVLNFVSDTLQVFGFDDFEVEISTRPGKSIGSDEDWNQATVALQAALDHNQMPYTINEGDGAFYGPKIDIKLKDCLGRTWQCATIQCDFALPERFDLNYISSTGEKVRPIMLHRVILGSIERFLGILIEHYAGNFPVWLAPVQIKVLSLSEQNNDYAQEVTKTLINLGYRVESDLRDAKVGQKVRDAELLKIPFMLVVGAKEVESRSVSVRRRKLGNQGTVPLGDFIETLGRIVAEKS